MHYITIYDKVYLREISIRHKGGEKMKLNELQEQVEKWCKENGVDGFQADFQFVGSEEISTRGLTAEVKAYYLCSLLPSEGKTGTFKTFAYARVEIHELDENGNTVNITPTDCYTIV